MSDATPEQPFPMRLQSSSRAPASRAAGGSEDLMTAGRVSVNGQIVTELGKVDPKVDVVCVDGREVHLEDGSVYLMLHKPKGYLTTMDDPQGRPCVAQLVPRDAIPASFRSAGPTRTRRALLFTTDGDMGQRLLHPKHHVDKTYQAHVAGVPDEVDLARLRGGIMLDDGLTAQARVRIVTERPDGSSDICLVIHEDATWQVKRMYAAVHHPVLDLHRSSFGPLELVDVEEGSWRLLTEDEVASLRWKSRDSRTKGVVVTREKETATSQPACNDT